MAKLLPGEEKIFLPLDGSCKVVSLLARDAIDVCLFQSASIIMSSGTCTMGFPGGASDKKKRKERKKNPPVNAGDIRDAGLERFSGVVSGNPLQYSCL